MGMGHLGRAAAAALVQLGFRVNGWTRTERPMEGGYSMLVEALIAGLDRGVGRA